MGKSFAGLINENPKVVYAADSNEHEVAFFDAWEDMITEEFIDSINYTTPAILEEIKRYVGNNFQNCAYSIKPIKCVYIKPTANNKDYDIPFDKIFNEHDAEEYLKDNGLLTQEEMDGILGEDILLAANEVVFNEVCQFLINNGYDENQINNADYEELSKLAKEEQDKQGTWTAREVEGNAFAKILVEIKNKSNNEVVKKKFIIEYIFWADNHLINWERIRFQFAE